MEGQTVSHYRVLEKLGGGGMSVVYKAEDTNLKRLVALKFLPPELTRDDEARQRFVQEAQAASALDHPNICTIHEIDTAPDGQMFIAMAYYDGETLKKRIARGPLAIGEALDIAIQIAQGLAEAHAAGIVHRDIKPANVMFTKGGQVKIVDFGIAKLSGQMGLTQTGTTLGTVAYMSPEQTRGGPGDQQTDIWSLGVVLYEMVTGQLPFPGGHPLGLMNAIQYEQPVPIRQLRLGIPDELERIVSRVLEKNREARYVSADELQRDLVTCRTALASPSLQVPALSQMLRTPKVAVLALVVLLLISLGAIWAYTRGADARWARQEAIPRILTLVGERNYQAAFDLAEKAERYIPADPLLASLWPQFTRTIKVESDPPGAQLYAKPFADVDGDWRSLGGTPLEARFPVGARWIQQLKLEKPGYETILDINYPFSDSLRLTLHAAGTRPAGMVWVSGASPPLRLPGLESLQAEPVDGFLVDQFEVTNRAYKEFVDAGGYRDQRLWRHPITADGRTLPWEEAMSLFRDTTGRLGPSTWEGGTFASGMDDHPVGGVSWYEAVAYAEFTNKRLPTIFHWNRVAITAAASQSVPLSNIDRSELGPVGSHQAIHRSGTRDLAGNVREWVWNETSRTGERFILGGGWSDPPYKFNDSYAALALDRSAINGFRCITLADETADIERVSRMIELPSLDSSPKSQSVTKSSRFCSDSSPMTERT